MSLYTANPNERETHTTVVAAADLLPLLCPLWSDLSPEGAKTLTAQYLHETGGGHYCFNFNLGNVKGSADQPHMYLRNVWECLLPEQAAHEVSIGGGAVHIATADEIKQHGWACASAKDTVVFQPPHYQCRFRAFDSLADGAEFWLLKHRSVARSYPSYLPALNSGDCVAAAHFLRAYGYYTGDETKYAAGMAAQRDRI